jgi:hypothetical protein
VCTKFLESINKLLSVILEIEIKYARVVATRGSIPPQRDILFERLCVTKEIMKYTHIATYELMPYQRNVLFDRLHDQEKL